MHLPGVKMWATSCHHGRGRQQPSVRQCLQRRSRCPLRRHHPHPQQVGPLDLGADLDLVKVAAHQHRWNEKRQVPTKIGPPRLVLAVAAVRFRRMSGLAPLP